MSKRGPDPNNSHYQHHNKYRRQEGGNRRQQFSSHDSRFGGNQQQQYGQNTSAQHPSSRPAKQQAHTQHSQQPPPKVDPNALSKLPPATSAAGFIPNFTAFLTPPSAPTLPLLPEGSPLASAPFKHKSSTNYSRSVATSTTSDPALDMTYEKLELYGDAYLEVLATRLIFHRYPHLPAGQMSQLRELLVKNETLAGYARLYGFENRLEVSDKESMLAGVKSKDGDRERGNKGMNKVLGDVFEAYLAAVILTDAEEGFAVAEKWMTGLWASKLVEAGYGADSLAATAGGSPAETFDPAAKALLQKRIVGNDVKLDYRVDKPSVELKGDQIGQNMHFVALYLTGWGYEGKLLGKGQGKNKAEAGAWAAVRAMHGESKGLVDECAVKLEVIREENRKRREAKEAEKAEKKAIEEAAQAAEGSGA